jgi:hypothetical protein
MNNNEYIQQIAPQYYENLDKVTRGDWTLSQWYDYCSVVLGEIMLLNKDVFERLKNR